MRLMKSLERTGGSLDALFNNGAYGLPSAVEDLPRDALRAFSRQISLDTMTLPGG